MGLSRFGLLTFSLSRFGLSRFGHLRFGHGFLSQLSGLLRDLKDLFFVQTVLVSILKAISQVLEVGVGIRSR